MDGKVETKLDEMEPNCYEHSLLNLTKALIMSKCSNITRVVISAMTALSMTVGASAVTIAKDGKSVAAIVLPDTTYPVVEHAARELQYHVQEASGARLSIVKESEKPQNVESYIYLGPTRAANEAGIDESKLELASFTIQSIGNDLFLVGRDNHYGVGSRDTRYGTLYAVYELLETEMGVRWLWPGKLGEVIPEQSTIRTSVQNLNDKPRFWAAGIGYKYPMRSGQFYWPDQKTYEDYINAQREWLLRHRLNTETMSLTYGHYFHKAGYYDRFFENRPDFFQQLPDGSRGYIPGMSAHVYSMCVSNPDLHKQIVQDWLNSPSRDPEHVPYRPFINLCENDSAGACTCDRCRSWDAPDPRFENHDYWGEGKLVPGDRYQMVRDSKNRPGPSLSDRYAKFYLAVQKEAEQYDPDAVVIGYAYSNYMDPPVETKLNDRVIIIWVGWPYFPWTDEDIESMRRNWEGWAATGARMMLRPNTMLSGHNFPIFLARKFGREFAYNAERGMIGTYFDSLTGQWATQGPNLYVLGRRHVRPDRPVEEILDEYYGGFGPAASDVRAYFEHWEDVSDGITEEGFDRYIEEIGGVYWGTWYKVAPKIFTPEVMVEGRALLTKAREAARGDPVAQQRVKFLEQGFRHAKLTLATAIAHARHSADPKNAAKETAYKTSLDRLVHYRNTIAASNGSNVGYLSAREAAGHKKKPGDGWGHVPAWEEESP